jgi:predicted nucleic acid-binding Zn ribbon protein
MKRSRKKKSAPEPAALNEVLSAAFKTLGLRSVVTLHKIKKDWEKVAGPHVARRTRPDAYRDKTLYLVVSDHTWMNELTFLKAELLNNLRQKCADIEFKDIHFKVGKLSTFRRSKTSPRLKKLKRALTLEESEFIDECLKDINDEELKEILTDTISRQLKLGLGGKKR